MPGVEEKEEETLHPTDHAETPRKKAPTTGAKPSPHPLISARMLGPCCRPPHTMRHITSLSLSLSVSVSATLYYGDSTLRGTQCNPRHDLPTRLLQDKIT